MRDLFLAVLLRDLKLASRRRIDSLLPVVFFIVALSLFPLGVGPEPQMLRDIAPGIVWVCALLASMLSVGSLFAATLLEARSRDVLLGIFLFPVVTPVIVAGAKGTAALMAGPAEAAGALVWLKLLFAFDLLFVTLSLWVFGPLTRGE